MRSNSFEIWTSNEVQGMLRVFLSQKTDFLARFWRFFDYTFLRPMSYALTFWQMKGLLMMHNRGKFYEYSNFGCQVINFQSWFSIHEMALLGVGAGGGGGGGIFEKL